MAKNPLKDIYQRRIEAFLDGHGQLNGKRFDYLNHKY